MEISGTWGEWWPFFFLLYVELVYLILQPTSITYIFKKRFFEMGFKKIHNPEENINRALPGPKYK